MHDDSGPPRLDPVAIDFPTDRITFGQLRRHSPEAFTYDALADLRAVQIDVFTAYASEIELAENAFSRALGRRPPHTLELRADTVYGLNDAYKRHGISTGIQHTWQLVREIEAAAVKQAGKHPGRGR